MESPLLMCSSQSTGGRLGDDGPRYETVVIIRFLSLSMISFERRSRMIWVSPHCKRFFLFSPLLFQKNPFGYFLSNNSSVHLISKYFWREKKYGRPTRHSADRWISSTLERWLRVHTQQAQIHTQPSSSGTSPSVWASESGCSACHSSIDHAGLPFPQPFWLLTHCMTLSSSLHWLLTWPILPQW